jgi:arabinose-5-phosphate isomerase
MCVLPPDLVVFTLNVKRVFHVLLCCRSPRSINPEAMAVDAMEKMEGPPSPVAFLPVVNNEGVVIGIVTLHDLVSSGL